MNPVLTQQDVDRVVEEKNRVLRDYFALLAAVTRHREQKGHDRCHENDAELYRAAGLEPVSDEKLPIEEHRLECDRYRAKMYSVPVETEPCGLLARLEKMLEVSEQMNLSLQQEIDQYEEVAMRGVRLPAKHLMAGPAFLAEYLAQVEAKYKNALAQQNGAATDASVPKV